MKEVCLINESSLIIYFSDKVSPDVADNVSFYVRLINEKLADYIIDMIPSYTSVVISIDLRKIDLVTFASKVKAILKSSSKSQTKHTAKTISIPVYYDHSVALDAEDLCQFSGLSFDEVIELHTQNTYRVYAIGFAPGFAYLGNVDKKIAIPRKTTPRAKVPKGSVAIADQQTAIYPKESPGGWHIIGRTPMELLDFQRESLSIFSMGALVKFESISQQEFVALGGCLDGSQQENNS